MKEQEEEQEEVPEPPKGVTVGGNMMDNHSKTHSSIRGCSHSPAHTPRTHTSSPTPPAGVEPFAAKEFGKVPRPRPGAGHAPGEVRELDLGWRWSSPLATQPAKP